MQPHVLQLWAGLRQRLGLTGATTLISLLVWTHAAVFAQPAPCAGDCDGDGRVSVPELITGVRIALAQSDVDSCTNLDNDADGTVTVAELVVATDNLLTGCPTTPDPALLVGTYDASVFVDGGSATPSLAWIDAASESEIELEIVVAPGRTLRLSGVPAEDGAIRLDGEMSDFHSNQSAAGSATAQYAESRIFLTGGVVVQGDAGETSEIIFSMHRPDRPTPSISDYYTFRLAFGNDHRDVLHVSLDLTATAAGPGTFGGALLLQDPHCSDAGETYAGTYRVSPGGRVYVDFSYRVIGFFDHHPVALLGVLPLEPNEIRGGIFTIGFESGEFSGEWLAGIADQTLEYPWCLQLPDDEIH